MILRRWFMTAGVACLLGSPHVARAQAPPGSEAMTAAAVADSLVVLRQLESTLRSKPNDAATWFRVGMIAWALSARDRIGGGMSSLDWTLLSRQADSSLRIAAQIEDNAQYRLMAGRFLLSSGVSITRAASYGFFEAALEAARLGSDKTAYADVAIEAGRVSWRRYDTMANRWSTISGRPCMYTTQIDGRMFIPTKADTALKLAAGARIVESELRASSMPLQFEDAGERDYLKAEELFREAYAAQPSFERAYRQLAMLYAERARWNELGALARDRTTNAPWDAWAWLTLGLATHRMGDERTAIAAFDSAFRVLAPADRARLDRLERILPLKDSLRYPGSNAAQRAALERHYWLSADPLWSRRDAEPRIEFLARVTFAELRWTVEEMKVKGADTDRAEVHIRYGPPDLIAVFGGPGEICTLWVYDVGYLFRFTGQPTFATAKYGDEDAVAEILAQSPARWDNLRHPRIDSMPSQAARFRAIGDSVDVYVAALPPVDSIRKNSDANSAVRADYWLLSGGTVAVAHDSVMPAAPGIRTFTHRVAPGVYVYRTEATAEDSRVAGRASAVVVATADSATGFAVSGFGMSDVVLATSVATPKGTPKRWSDLGITPLLGAAGAEKQLTLVWENYGLSAESGSARYNIALLLVRERSLKGKIAARIVGSVGSRVGIDQTDDRLAMRFDRSAPQAATILENVALSLGQTPAGRYRLTVEITDQISGLVTSRTLLLVIQ